MRRLLLTASLQRRPLPSALRDRENPRLPISTRIALVVVAGPLGSFPTDPVRDELISRKELERTSTAESAPISTTLKRN